MERCISREAEPIETSDRSQPEIASPGPSELVAGLCGACESLSSCTLRSRVQAPVLQCDEFSGGPLRARPPEFFRVEEASGAAWNGVRGLCANCARFDACRFPRQEGGVWQCEEYC